MCKSFHSLSADDFQLLQQHQPRIKTQQSHIKAAVSVILREGPNGTEILLMQRAHHDADPWSGQMAFPGGKIEPSDAGPQQAAMRETLEEVGIELSDKHYVGRLNDLYSFKIDDVYGAHLSSFVFCVDEDVQIVPNYEVADTVWLPLAWLESEHNYLLYETSRIELPKMPSVLIDTQKQQVLWGLTLRIVVHLFDIIKHPMQVFEPTVRQTIQQIELDEE
jgi:8-oxo-dGTP pyrophosphatase MutT (NUDIX family)